MIDRHRITVEEVLRRESRNGELKATLQMVSSEVPALRRTAAVLVGLAVCEVAASVVVALAARSLIGSVLADPSGSGESEVSASVVAIALLAAVGAFIATRQRQIFAHDVVLACRERGVGRLAARINTAPYADLSAVPMATLREILMTDVDHIYRFGVDLVTKAVVITLWTVAASALTIWLSWPIFAVLAVVSICAALLVRQSLRKHGGLTDERFGHLAELSQRAREVVEVDRIVLARQLGLGNHFVDRFIEGHGRYVAVLARQQTLTANLRAALVGLNGIAFVIVIVVGALLIDAGELGVGALIAVSFAISQLLVSVIDLGDYVQRSAETVTAGRRLAAYWDDPYDREPAADIESVVGTDPAQHQPTPSAGSGPSADVPARVLTADGVSFGYHDQPVLRGLDLEIRRGELACLTGATGAGKSTLGLLLTGVLEPDRGTIKVDGTAVRSLSRPPLYIGPSPILIEGSVLDNLFIDESEVDRVRLERLFSHLASWNMALDEPVVSSQGTGLSSGQAQTVALARAWVRNPQIIVFDEATSSLDMPTEAAVQNEMLEWASERIVLAISHRTCPWVQEARHRVRMGTDADASLVIDFTRPSSTAAASTIPEPS